MSGQPSLSKSAAAAPMPYGPARLPVAADDDHRRRAARTRDAGVVGDVRERPVAAIAIQEIRAAGKAKRTARHRECRCNCSRRSRPAWAPLQGRTAGSWPRTDPDGRPCRSPGRRSRRTARPEPARDSGLLGHVSEGAVPVVVVQHVPAPVRHEQIVEAVVVVVADAARLTPARMREASPAVTSVNVPSRLL